MDDQELRKLIAELHAEIQNTHVVDEKSQELLRDLEADIRGLIERAGGQITPVHPSTIQRLETGLDQFELSHPALTALISRVLETLSNAGI